MEEKNLKLPVALSFDIQRFATAIEIKNGTYEIKLNNNKKITCSFSGITGIGTTKLTTDLISVKNDTLTIGKNFTTKFSATKASTVSFTGKKTSSDIKVSSMTVGNGVTANITAGH